MLQVGQVDEGAAPLGRALGRPAASRLLLALLGGPASTARLALAAGLSRDAAVEELARLRRDGLVVAVPAVRTVRYRLAGPALTRGLLDLVDVLGAVVIRPKSGLRGRPARRPAASAPPFGSSPRPSRAAPPPGGSPPRRPRS